LASVYPSEVLEFTSSFFVVFCFLFLFVLFCFVFILVMFVLNYLSSEFVNPFCPYYFPCYRDFVLVYGFWSDPRTFVHSEFTSCMRVKMGPTVLIIMSGAFSNNPVLADHKTTKHKSNTLITACVRLSILINISSIPIFF